MPSISGRMEVNLTVRDPGTSAAWYTALLDLEELYDHTAADGRMRYVALVEPESRLVLGLVGHVASRREQFDELRTGLDHLEFLVDRRADLDEWAARLTRLGIPHSGVKEPEYTRNAMLTFRDPDNIQLEFFWRAPTPPFGPPPDVRGHDARVESLEIATRIEPVGSGAICRRILDALPHWFGIPESVVEYVAAADRAPSVIASTGGNDVGITTIVTHSPYAAEVYVMGVLPEYHRNGIGRSMLRAAEEMLASAGVEFLQVKTRSGSKPDVGYERTRAFYQAYGFRPLEEFPDLWDADNPALLMVKTVATPGSMAR